MKATRQEIEAVVLLRDLLREAAVQARATGTPSPFQWRLARLARALGYEVSNQEV